MNRGKSRNNSVTVTNLQADRTTQLRNGGRNRWTVAFDYIQLNNIFLGEITWTQCKNVTLRFYGAVLLQSMSELLHITIGPTERMTGWFDDQDTH
jgi:hypothetical protein